MPSSSRSRDRRLSRPRRRRWPLVALVLILLAAGAGGAFVYLNETRDEGTPPSADPSADAGEELVSPFEEELAVTEDARAARVESVLNVRMPRTLDDGVPRRRISGEGTLATDLSVARVEYGMSEIPNSAGYFGHVDGDLPVVYADNEMIFTFPLLDENVLEDASWFSYELPFLSTEFLLGRGIGQLRELALSDPRVGLALLHGVHAEAESAGQSDVAGKAVTGYEVDASVSHAADAVPELEPIFTEMRENLQMSSIPMAVSVDDEGRVRRLVYDLVFPSKKGPGKVRLKVTHELTRFGVRPPRVPPPDEVVTYEEFFLEQ